MSYVTYPGADHNRLAHSLGVLHLMQQALDHLQRTYNDEQISQARATLLAAALIHDVGHGPFSHLFEPCPGIDHEEWSIRIILSEESEINKVLRQVDLYLPQKVADLVDKNNYDHPAWMKYLLSSQLDVDRLDYLRRDSLFTGAGYGHFDWYRILNTFELYEETSGAGRDIVWPEKSKFAIEEFTVLQQIQQWKNHTDKPLSDLARRFLARDRFLMVVPPEPEDQLAPDYEPWEEALLEKVREAGYDPPDIYCLKDTVKAKYNQPYFPEKEDDEQRSKNAIRLLIEGESKPIEISKLLDRLKPVTQEPADQIRYCVPLTVNALPAVQKLRAEWIGERV